MNFEPDPEKEAQLEQADTNALLLAMLGELTAIREELQNVQEREEPQQYTCDLCNDAVQEDKREAHLDEHNAPPSIAMDDVFTAI